MHGREVRKVETVSAVSYTHLYVIDAERQSFVYGDSERGIRGCVANGIDEKAANSIYDSMAVSYTHLDVYKRQVLCNL